MINKIKKLSHVQAKVIYEKICKPTAGNVMYSDYINHLTSKLEMSKTYKTTALKEKEDIISFYVEHLSKFSY